MVGSADSKHCTRVAQIIALADIVSQAGARVRPPSSGSTCAGSGQQLALTVSPKSFVSLYPDAQSHDGFEAILLAPVYCSVCPPSMHGVISVWQHIIAYV